jgi:hypothetical protein
MEAGVIADTLDRVFYSTNYIIEEYVRLVVQLAISTDIYSNRTVTRSTITCALGTMRPHPARDFESSPDVDYLHCVLSSE